MSIGNIPGDSGLPTTIDWDLPAGFTAGPLQWPVPERFDSDGLATYGYPGKVLLLTEIQPPKSAQTGIPVVLKARAGWLACRVECTPGNASLDLSLPVKPGDPSADPRWAALFREARSHLPLAAPTGGFTATGDAGTVTLVQSGPPPANAALSRFYPDTPGQVSVSAPQVVTVEGSSVRVTLQREKGAGQLKRLSGLLVTPAFGARSAVDRRRARFSGREQRAPREHQGAAGLIVTILLAFVGGLILNLMPCVLPVISLKVIAFARHGADGGEAARGKGCSSPSVCWCRSGSSPACSWVFARAAASWAGVSSSRIPRLSSSPLSCSS